MATSSPWPLIHGERKALADDLANLDDAGWATPSLCAHRSVRDVLAHMTATAKMTPAKFRSLLTATSHPPGPVEAMLGEAVIHSEDIRRPLGIKRQYPNEAVVRVADFYKGSNLIVGAKSRIAGLKLTATDTQWSTGSGPEVTGPILSLVMVMTGRSVALDDLAGDGLTTLRSRL